MSRLSRLTGIGTVLICAATVLQGQNNPVNLWTGIGLEKGLGKNWEVSLDQEWRLTEKKDPNEFLLEGAVSYEPLKYLDLGARYRFALLMDQEDGREFTHQMAFDIRGKYNFGRFRFQLRTRLTNYSDLDMGVYLVNPYLRYRFKMEYDIKGIALFPMCSMELFHQLEDREINKLRYSLGLEYRINKSNRIELKYHLQDYLKKDYYRNIISLQYDFLF